MPIYKFSFAPDAAGLDVTVKNFRTGEVVDTGSLSDTPDVDGVVTYKPSLTEGVYCAEVEVPGQAGLDGEKHPSRTRTELGTLDLVASIAQGGGGTPTADTAFLIATGTVATDSSEHPLTVDWDDRFPQVDWLDITAGSATIPDGALKCTVGQIAEASIATAISSGGNAGGLFKVYNDADAVVNTGFTEAAGPASSPVAIGPAGPQASVDPVDFAPGAAVVIKAMAYADDDGSTPIEDAQATFTVAVAITRGGSAPTLP